MEHCADCGRLIPTVVSAGMVLSDFSFLCVGCIHGGAFLCRDCGDKYAKQHPNAADEGDYRCSRCLASGRNPFYERLASSPHS
jgi:hypothetical protein